MAKGYRHGDLALIETNSLPGNAKKSKTKILMRGSNNNSHSFNNGTFYKKSVDQFVFGYLEAKNTTLFHKDHGVKIKNKELREAKIKDGIYELRRQFEDTNDGIKVVID